MSSYPTTTTGPLYGVPTNPSRAFELEGRRAQMQAVEPVHNAVGGHRRVAYSEGRSPTQIDVDVEQLEERIALPNGAVLICISCEERNLHQRIQPHLRFDRAEHAAWEEGFRSSVS